MRTVSTVIVLLFLSAGLMAADKPPWLWTTEERVQALGDVSKRAERLQAYETRKAVAHRRGSPRANAAEIRMPLDVINGQRDPHLFFATDLFKGLVYSSFVSLPRVYPRWVMQQSDDVLTTQEQWDRFAQLTSQFAMLVAREQQLLAGKVGMSAMENARIDRELADVRAGECDAMRVALRAVREEFGRERFDRLLYVVVARGKSVTYANDPLGGDDAVAHLIQRERQCQ